MRTQHLLLAAMSLVSCRGGHAPPPPIGGTPPTGAPGPTAAAVDEGEDVLPRMNQMNGPDQAKPPTEFRKGHVTPKPLDPASLKTRANGFAVQFPARAQMVTPAVYRGLVVTSGGFNSKELYAFDAKKGTPIWAVALDDDGPSTPACDDGVCVINTESCTIFAIEAETGKMLWSWWLGDPLASSPTIASGRVFTSYPAAGPMGATHALAAFDLKSGKILWQKWIDADVLSAPVAVDGELWATTFAGTLYRFEPASGQILSARSTRATSAPVVVGKDIYYSRRSDEGGAAGEALVAQGRDLAGPVRYEANKKRAAYLDGRVQDRSTMAKKGESDDSQNGLGAGASSSAYAARSLVGQKSVSTMQSFQGSRVLVKDGSNVSTMGDEIVATDPKSGATKWSRKLEGDVARDGGFLATPPVSAGDSIVVATLKGDLLRLDPTSGKERARWKVDGEIRSQPIVQDGWIYVGTTDGRIVAVDTGDRSLSGWSQWGKNAARTGLD